MTSVVVIDSSVVLAHFFNEPGAEEAVHALSRDSVVSAVGWSEMKQKLQQRGFSWTQAVQVLDAFKIVAEPVTVADAERAADLWKQGSGLSIADRLCLALGQRLNAEILTADKAWAGMPGVTVIR